MKVEVIISLLFVLLAICAVGWLVCWAKLNNVRREFYEAIERHSNSMVLWVEATKRNRVYTHYIYKLRNIIYEDIFKVRQYNLDDAKVFYERNGIPNIYPSQGDDAESVVKTFLEYDAKSTRHERRETT